MDIKHILQLATAFLVCGSAAADGGTPLVSDVVMTQPEGRRTVVITYRLENAPAVVTLDVQTNCTVNGETKWVSIGGPAVCNAQGAVWRKVTSADLAGDKYEITWRPDLSWEGNAVGAGGARAVVTAWSLDNTPDYMTVDISHGAEENPLRYYPAVDFLPGSAPGQTGAVTNNPIYKTTMLLMRKIMAKDIVWTMGSTVSEVWRSDNEHAVNVALDGNYYIGVFEITQSQWGAVVPGSAVKPLYTIEGPARPMEKASWNDIRGSNWPAAAAAGSFLGELNRKSGLDFDLPSEAQWEYAARSGHGSGYWGDGSAISLTVTGTNFGKWDVNGALTKLGRFIGNHSGANNAASAPAAGGTATVGSYAPSSWGLYDMHGNVYEFCLDWYEDDISGHGGKVNVDAANPACSLSGAAGTTRVTRGGGYPYPGSCARAAYRSGVEQSLSNQAYGFRVVCKAGLE